MDIKELEKDQKDVVPKYKVTRRFNNRNNKDANTSTQNKQQYLNQNQNGKHRSTNHKQTIENMDLTDSEKLKQRAARFSSQKPDSSTKNQYGYVSRGEDDRLQRSHKERVKFYDQIISSFIAYVNENTSPKLAEDFDKLVNKDEITPKTQERQDKSTINSILNSLRKLREAMLFGKANAFTKKVYLFSIRVSVNIGHYQTYIPSITFLLHPSNLHLLSNAEKQEISTLLVLHIAHFNKENSKALQLYFRYIDLDNIKTLQVLKCWVEDDYYNWLKYYNNETNNGKASIMKFGLKHMVTHMINTVSKSYYTLDLKHFENNYLPNGYTYNQLTEDYDTKWKVNGDSIAIRERNVK